MKLYNRIYKFPVYGAARAIGDTLAGTGLGIWLFIALVIIGLLKAIG
ncbi:MAG: hypothetical protein HOP30_10155 [Cyclobacteriaceae bacterium]|nr:hypothetical protein [Cyclobacteriaceae bacterium]